MPSRKQSTPLLASHHRTLHFALLHPNVELESDAYVCALPSIVSLHFIPLLFFPRNLR